MRKAVLWGASMAALITGCVFDKSLGDLDGATGGTGTTEATGGAQAGDDETGGTAGTGGGIIVGPSTGGMAEDFSELDPSGCGLTETCDAALSGQGTEVKTELSSKDQSDIEELAPEIADLDGLSAVDFAARYSVKFADGPTYDPTTALSMDTLQGSSLALDERELAALSREGFVISELERFPNFVYGYEQLYAEDLPLYVSADSILYAVHESYDTMLKQIELSALIPALERLIESMRSSFPRLARAGFGEQAQADVDLYLTIAASLLTGRTVAPVASASADEVDCFLYGIATEEGCLTREIFGVPRSFDFSQYTVRGHYTDEERPELARYFKTMMWLGREDLRLIQTDSEGKQWFQRRQLDAALALRELIDDQALLDWKLIDKAVGAFVGEHDSMTVPQLSALLGDLGVAAPSELADVSDEKIAQAIITGRYGTQRICSHIMVNAAGAGTMPLHSSFLLFGQRYVLDSHVFSNVVFDRVQCGPQYCRMMPNPLDAAFGALRNDQAGELLAPELETYADYPRALASMRVLAEAHPAEYWEDNLYNLWVGALRTLSPGPEAAEPARAGLPTVAGSEAWGKRLLNTQLASWSELRHDTLLYAKQSYTMGMTICEYPDAYIEPYPAFWTALAKFADHGKALVTELELPTGNFETSVEDYFTHLSEVATRLGAMAEHQRTGAPHSAEDIAFINQAVRVQRGGGCGGPTDGVNASGWYADLFLTAADRVAYDPSIADVHTQPTDENGEIVGRVLHVGTGMPRLMVVTADTCAGPRAYVGMASSYFERITDDFDRLTDEQWSEELQTATPEDVAWMSELVVR